MEILLINYCLCILAFLGCYGVAMGAYWLVQKAKKVTHQIPQNEQVPHWHGFYKEPPRTSAAAKDRAASWWKQQRVRKA